MLDGEAEGRSSSNGSRKQCGATSERVGKTTVSLAGMLEKDLAAEYGVSRDLARKVRTKVVSEFVENSKSTNDK